MQVSGIFGLGGPEVLVLLVILVPIAVLVIATKRAKAVELEQLELMKSMSGMYRTDFVSRRKSPHVGMILAFFLGNVGAHRFYLRQTGLGILYVLCFWTLIPGLIALAEVYLMPDRVRRYNANLAAYFTEKQGQKAVTYTESEIEVVKESLRNRSGSITARKVSDDALVVYQDCDLNSAVIGRPAKGTEIQIGSFAEIGGRQWFEVALPNGDRGHTLAASARSHTAL